MGNDREIKTSEPVETRPPAPRQMQANPKGEPFHSEIHDEHLFYCAAHGCEPIEHATPAAIEQARPQASMCIHGLVLGVHCKTPPAPERTPPLDLFKKAAAELDLAVRIYQRYANEGRYPEELMGRGWAETQFISRELARAVAVPEPAAQQEWEENIHLQLDTLSVGRSGVGGELFSINGRFSELRRIFHAYATARQAEPAPTPSRVKVKPYIIGVIPWRASGPGWANQGVNVIKDDRQGKIFTECLYLKDHPQLHDAWHVGIAANSILLREIEKLAEAKRTRD